MDKLNLLQLFSLVANKGSFAAAASFLGQSPSTVSKAVSRLEKDVGVRLFHRTTRQLNLTEAGEQYLLTVRQVLESLEQSEHALTQHTGSPSGTLKIALPVSYGLRYISPMIPAFQEKYPDIIVDMVLTDEYSDIVKMGADVAIRSGRLEDSRLIAKKLSPIDMAIYATPEIAAQLPEKLDKRVLESTPWVHFRFKQSGKYLPIFFREQGEDWQELSPPITLVTDNGSSLTSLACNGGGLVYLPHFLAKEHVRVGQLVQVGEARRDPNIAVYLYYTSREFMPVKTRVFIDHLVTELQAMGENSTQTWLL